GLAGGLSLPAPPRFSTSCETSRALVSYPAVAATWAIPLPIKPQPSTPTRWMSANSSAPLFGAGLRILERLAHFFGNPDEGSRARQLALVGRAAFPVLKSIEHLLQRDLQALVRAAVGAGDHGPSRRQADAGHEHQRLRERER